MGMTPEVKSKLSKTIRGLRETLPTLLGDALEARYRLSVPLKKAALDEEGQRKRERLQEWIDEQVQTLPAKQRKAGNAKAEAEARFRGELVKRAAYTWLNRLVYLRLLEGMGLRETAVLTGVLGSQGYTDFRDYASALVGRDDGDDSNGYIALLQMVFDELALDLPGLFGRAGLAELVPMQWSTLRAVLEALDDPALNPAEGGCWDDDMTLGWVYQYWNDPDREALDAKLNSGGKVAPHEIASKTQMFTERYMVDWLLQNSLGPMWLAMCKHNGWTPHAESQGVLDRLEERRKDWRAKREAGEVELTALMPLHSDMERRWAYYVPQPMPEDAPGYAPKTIRELKLLDPAVGSGHFLVVAFELLVALYREEAEHCGEAEDPKWSDKAIVESILENNLHGIDLDPRAVQIAAAALWLKAQQVAPVARPSKLNLVASQLRLASLPKDDPRLVELRERVDREAGIPAAVTDEVVQALKGADHLGSLLKVGDALDTALEKYTGRKQPQQGSLLGQAFEPEQKIVEFSTEDAKERLVMAIEAFLAAHTGSADLGLRLRGEQLAVGVRFLRSVREGAYHLVVGNPPYQGTSKMEAVGYVTKRYPRGKADLFAAFLERGLELAQERGVSALLTMRSWMFIKQYANLRTHLLETHDLRALGDFAIGAFDEVPNDLLSVVVSIFHRNPPRNVLSIAVQPTPPGDTSYDRGRTKRKRAASLCQFGRYEFKPLALRIVPEWPLVYWWEEGMLRYYSTLPTLGSLYPVRQGMATSDNPRFLRRWYEVLRGGVSVFELATATWPAFIRGGGGRAWIEPVIDVVKWHRFGLEVKSYAESKYASYTRTIKNEQWFGKIGVSFAAIGNRFSASAHRVPGVFGHTGSSVFGASAANVVTLLNSRSSRAILDSLNPGVHYEVGDVNRLPFVFLNDSAKIFKEVENAFAVHESHRETSAEYCSPGPSPWAYAQAWAQGAVDRPEGAPLPAYTEQPEVEPPTDHISFALGVALGRFGAPPSLGAKQGILDPSTDDLSHALPHGILFLDGTLDADSKADSLAHDACALLREKWKTHGPKIETKRKTLRGYLRLDFFKDVHRAMYENRPIHWPLSSKKRTFVAWINIHRWHAGTLRTLLAEHLNEALRRLASDLTDLRKTRDGADAKAARNAEKRLDKVSAWHDELSEFIDLVKQHAELGPDGRIDDAIYDPNLDDGVMVNSAALWPLLEPQWKDPKKWWKELVAAKGRKDYDWSHLARRYFRERVEEKCTQDPSLGVAHGCFWKYHPAKAYAWELRLQDEIGPDFTIDEDGSDGYRKEFLEKQANEAREIEDKERKRRLRKVEKAGAAAQSELTADA